MGNSVKKLGFLSLLLGLLLAGVGRSASTCSSTGPASKGCAVRCGCCSKDESQRSSPQASSGKEFKAVAELVELPRTSTFRVGFSPCECAPGDSAPEQRVPMAVSTQLVLEHGFEDKFSDAWVAGSSRSLCRRALDHRQSGQGCLYLRFERLLI